MKCRISEEDSCWDEDKPGRQGGLNPCPLASATVIYRLRKPKRNSQQPAIDNGKQPQSRLTIHRLRQTQTKNKQKKRQCQTKTKYEHESTGKPSKDESRLKIDWKNTAKTIIIYIARRVTLKRGHRATPRTSGSCTSNRRAIGHY